MPDRLGFDRESIFAEKPRIALQENIEALCAIFHVPENKDIVLRKFTICGSNAFVCFLEGLLDPIALSEYVLAPCLLKSETPPVPTDKRLSFVREEVLFASQSREVTTFQEISREILSGMCIMFIDECESAIAIDIRKVPHRLVNRTNNESVVLGSQEGFVENLRTNISLVRKNLQSSDLITEMFDIGNRNALKAALMYVNGVTDAQAVNEARERLLSIDRETVSGTGQIQQLIEDHPFSLFPQMLQTERPDRAAQGLSEGQFAILSENSPYALLAPVTIFHFMHASDDAFMRWQYGSFLRLIRFLGICLSLFLPAFYIALTQYHTHLLPMNLLTSIAEARSNVPFPILGEILFMEFSFNLINEAGTRIPSQIGSALGIVGALILGQAAVSASIISPILIIIVAITGLGNFAVPSYSMSVAMEIYRLFLLIAGAFFGLYGIVLVTVLMISSIASMRSFSSPFLSPFAPFRPHNPDLFLRLPIWLQKPFAFYSKKNTGKGTDE
ncbi:MAG: spore germination protein [Clostridia bacterium]|nr:spore germination protein [Clostridia bacterium]MBQ4157447.1 spore germination protein [Clostridia bacterium]